jgi:hypothetical protein
MTKNQNKLKLVIAVVIGLVTVAIAIATIGISSSNKEIRLRSEIKSQKLVCEAYYDKLWKVIAQKAEIANQYKEDFKEIYPKLIEGRYGNEKGGSLMKFIQESNPKFDISLYKDLMLSIEAERMGFFMEQKKLIDINNEHTIIRQTFPSSIFVGGRPDEKIKIVSSTATKKVMESGKEDEIGIYKK